MRSRLWWWSQTTAAALLLLLCSCNPTKVTSFATPASGDGVMRSMPEQVVEAQLKLLQIGDIQSAFELNSLDSQAETGPWQEYASLLSEPPFDVVVGHAKATILMEMHQKDLEIVSFLVYILPSSSSKKKIERTREFLWEVSRYSDDGAPDGGCWMVDTVVPDFEDMTEPDFDAWEDAEDPLFEF